MLLTGSVYERSAALRVTKHLDLRSTDATAFGPCDPDSTCKSASESVEEDGRPVDRRFESPALREHVPSGFHTDRKRSGQLASEIGRVNGAPADIPSPTVRRLL